MEIWGQLWALTRGEDSERAIIEVDVHEVRTVTLIWPDGTRKFYYLSDDNRWVFAGILPGRGDNHAQGARG